MHLTQPKGRSLETSIASADKQARSDAIIAEQVRVIYKKAPIALATVPANAALTVVVLWSSSSSKTLLISWLGTLILLTAVRAFGLAAFHRAAPPAEKARVWARRFTVGATLNGIVWGFGGAFIYPVDNLLHQVLLAFVLGGMSAGAVSSASAYLPAMVGFIAPCTIPVAIRMLLSGDTLHLAMGTMCLLFAIALIAIGRTGCRSIVDNVRLRIEKEALADKLVSVLGDLREAHGKLEHQLAERSVDLENTLTRAVNSEATVARFDALLDQAHVAIFVADTTTQRLVDSNQTGRRLFPGCQSEKANLSDLMLGESLANEAAWIPMIKRVRDEGPVHVEIHRSATGGVVEFFDVDIAFHSHGNRSYILIVAEDISERKSLEAELAQSRLLASLGRLAAGVAHEINNPLSYVISNVRYVHRQLADQHQQRQLLEAVAEARDGAERIRSIVRDLTMLSRREPDAIRAVDLNEVIRACTNVVKADVRHRLEIVLRLNTIPLVSGTTARLSQVFLNLLSNAAQAIDGNDPVHNRITVTTLSSPDGVVQAKVHDTGHGIEDAVLKRLFEPFFTTKQVGQGTGLGLAICRSIVDSINGRISVETQRGVGSTFTVTLPIAASDLPLEGPRMTSRSTAEQSIVTMPKKVLIIDDDTLVAKSLARVIQRYTAQISIAGSAHEGMAMLAADGPYDVVFCDLLMPEMTGMDLYRHVRQESPETASRFVFVTGAITDEAQAFLDSVPNACLTKPFDMDRLRDMLLKSRPLDQVLHEFKA